MRRDASTVVDELIHIQLGIQRTQTILDEQKRERDNRIYEANETWNIPIATMATALGLRRETVANAKLRAQTRYLIERTADGSAA